MGYEIDSSLLSVIRKEIYNDCYKNADAHIVESNRRSLDDGSVSLELSVAREKSA
jgi:hypothetical protein